MTPPLTHRPKSPSPNIGGYRYFFNGQEADNEVFGEVANYTAEFWQYDSRLGRRWNIDPVFKAYESPYACFAGNPIWHIDPKGKKWETVQDKKKADELKSKANETIKTNNQLIKNIEKRIDKLTNKDKEKYGNEISKLSDIKNELQTQNQLLQEGINDLEKMGRDCQVFAFKKNKEGSESGVKLEWKGIPFVPVISIEYDSDPLAWHEKTHVGDWMRNPFLWSFDRNGYLGIKMNASFLSLIIYDYMEIHAYRSQYAYEYLGDYFVGVKKISDINHEWLYREIYQK